MIWATGSGRCGTQSVAQWLTWPHEPGEFFLQEIFEGDEVRIIDLLETCLGADVPGVVDARFIHCLPLIEKLDPKAKFIYIFRSPSETVQSWLHRWKGRYPDYYPQFQAKTPAEKFAQFWKWTYEKSFDHPGEYVEADEIPLNLDFTMDIKPLPQAADMEVLGICGPLYRKMLGRIGQERPVYDALEKP